MPIWKTTVLKSLIRAEITKNFDLKNDQSISGRFFVIVAGSVFNYYVVLLGVRRLIVDKCRLMKKN